MRVTSSLFLLAIAALSQQSVQAVSANVQDALHKVAKYSANSDIRPGAFIVELDGEPGSTNVQAIAGSATSSFAKTTSKFTVDKQYSTLFNGFSVKTTENFDPIQLAIAARTSGSLERASRSVLLTAASTFNHPELGNCWKTFGCMWQLGYDLVGDDYDPNDPVPVIKPGPHPMDCTGHGTHVAGIIAGQGPQVIGVAQDATMGMYRVFGCPKNGKGVTTSDDVIIAAAEAAYRDGADIISLSLGGVSWPEGPSAVVCSNLAKKGVVVVAANGNDGASGLYTAGAPAVGSGVLSVGSVDNWNNTGGAADIITPSGDKRISISLSSNENIPFVFNPPAPIAAAVDSANSNLGCATISQDLKGKIALIQRGTCTFNEKVVHAQAAGATGVVIYNNVAGAISPSVTDTTVTIPVVGISLSDGQYIVSALDCRGCLSQGSEGETGGQMSSFSSYGPSAELDIAPRISAPGGNIYSTVPINMGRYGSKSGTSMATPYTSGTVALLKQAFPKYSVAEIHRVLINSAKPRADAKTGKNIHPVLERRWSGQYLRCHHNPCTSVSADGVEGFSSSQSVRWAVRTIDLKNLDKKKSARVSFSNSVADSLSNWNADGSFAVNPRVWPADASGSQGPTTLPQVYVPDLQYYDILEPGEKRSVDVFIIAPYGLKESDRWFYGGFLNFTMTWSGEKNTAKSFTVPYTGFNGNYRQLDVLSQPSEGLPILTDTKGIPIEGTKFSVTDTTPAVVNFRLEVPSRIVKVTLVDMKNTSLGYVTGGYLEYVPRNLQAAETYLYTALVTKRVFQGRAWHEAC
ncbi:subtilisin-like protein [Linderina pennispora]|uniref:Subtilisin-like protein n=1 Tax=Linderina pennispora TaxID=61395 RepID=A0A1Y1WMT1_9FUNG|nr:subtilisin-like protein [Linderina pennispora]ORX74869.1 subtilisin-like protein [Linderina pennispora]